METSGVDDNESNKRLSVSIRLSRDEIESEHESINQAEAGNGDEPTPEITMIPRTLVSYLGSYWEPTGERRRATGNNRSGNTNDTTTDF